MSATLPVFERTADSPELAADFEGIVINVPREVRVAAHTALPLSGAFQVTAEALDALPRRDPFAALTVLLIQGSTHRSVAFRPARSAIRLEPESRPGGRVRGDFHVDAFEMANVAPAPGRWFVSAWLGDLRSESIPFEVTAPPGHDRAGAITAP